MTRDAKRATFRISAGLLLLGLLLFILWRYLRTQGLSPEALRPEDLAALAQTWGAWGVVGSILLMVLHSFLPLPAEIIAMGNGMMFGPWGGILVTWGGAMLGACLSFALSRLLGQPFLETVLPPSRRDRILGLSPKPLDLLIVRLIPLISFNVVNYGAGLIGVPWGRFLWTTALGILPLTVAMVLLGGRIFDAPWWSFATVAAILALWLAMRASRLLR